MSYRQTVSREIAVNYSGSVSYPPSEHGGSMSYSGTAYETVNVDIVVDTNAFDSSVQRCNNHINALTASVGAMNTAQCVAIKDHADKISDTIIEGFFHSIRTDLSAQKSELEQRVEARLMLLRQQAQSLMQKKETMQTDYARTSERYLKIFDDLNKELSTRIHQIDKPVFSLVGSADEQSDRMLHTDMVQTAVTGGKESGVLQAQISAAIVKSDALGAMRRAEDFLVSEASSERLVRHATVRGSGEGHYYLPVCYMETVTEGGTKKRQVYVPERFQGRADLLRRIMDTMDSTDLGGGNEERDAQVSSFMQSEINEHLPKNDGYTLRVKKMINRLLSK